MKKEPSKFSIEHIPCKSCGERTIVNVECDNHCIIKGCSIHDKEPEKEWT